MVYVKVEHDISDFDRITSEQDMCNYIPFHIQMCILQM